MSGKLLALLVGATLLESLRAGRSTPKGARARSKRRTRPATETPSGHAVRWRVAPGKMCAPWVNGCKRNGGVPVVDKCFVLNSFWNVCSGLIALLTFFAAFIQRCERASPPANAVIVVDPCGWETSVERQCTSCFLAQHSLQPSSRSHGCMYYPIAIRFLGLAPGHCDMTVWVYSPHHTRAPAVCTYERVELARWLHCFQTYSSCVCLWYGSER